ncbi:S9 family peptidase [Idiomarina sp. HP20-50]|uniref:S9 family peptidase n=1 Tax=Idiomarina sp. HP20-50 TaxID=3070813 RepID=UPI00294AC60D|nr:S9 family peptidase [Idiomarina sp. HP20-50]MDV6316854.1 S9 family peptidase [Idiomarina sp. HP20-50]
MPFMLNRGIKTVTVFIFCALSFSVYSAELTIERLFSAPSLTGETPRALEFAPGGKYLSYLQGSEQSPQRYDLWVYNIQTGEHKQLVSVDQLAVGDVELSDEEKARRERQRISGSGIIDYTWSATGEALLFPYNGDVFYYRPGEEKARQLTKTEAFETDVKLSPQGNYVSFIREQNLYFVDIASGQETAVTTEGHGNIKFGMAEFVAQEEMDRMTGYWWAPDESSIALTKVDETPVPLATRSEIYADRIETVQQRYPFAGSENVKIDLGIYQLADEKMDWLELGKLDDGYLARVKWVGDSNRLSYQWQSRDQQRLTLWLYNHQNKTRKKLLTETADTWLNLHNDLYFLDDNKHFIWASERSGFKHLYLYRLDGSLIRQLSSGDWQVDELEAVDESTGTIYFTARKKSPLESHLYRTQLNANSAANPTRITSREGMHDIQFAANERSYIDTFSSPEQPKQVSLHGPTGNHLAWLAENRLNESHPLSPYLKQWRYPEFGTLEAEDGQTLYYKITKPTDFDAEKTYPVLVYVYGGPGAQRVTKSWGSEFVQYMAQQGFIVFTLDNRGSANRGKQFEAPIYKNMGTPEIADQVAGVNYLKSLPYVDKDRIGIYGHSYGGYMALLAMFKAPDHFQAGVAGAPVTDWRLYDTHYTERFMGMPGEGSAYEMSSVFPYSKNLKGDLLIYHGMADDNVLFTHSTKLYKQLQDNAQPFEMMNYPGKKHSINGRNTKIHLYSMIAQFFQQTIGEQ